MEHIASESKRLPGDTVRAFRSQLVQHAFSWTRLGWSNIEETMIIMPHALKQMAYWVCIAASGAVLAGCAETSYPTLPTIPSVGDSLLSPNEQQKAIKDLSSERAQTGEVEKPGGASH
jgi:hypothetical protein